MPGALAPGEFLPPASAISGRFQARPEAGERELVPPPLPGTTVAPWGPARCSSCRHLPSPLPLPSPHDSAPTPQASSPFFQLTKLLLPLFGPHRTPFLRSRLTSPHPRGSGPGLCPGGEPRCEACTAGGGRPGSKSSYTTPFCMALGRFLESCVTQFPHL